MSYWTEYGGVGRAEDHWLRELVEGYFESDNKEEGGFKTVFDTPRGTKGKISKKSSSSSLSDTDDNPLFPWAINDIADLSDYGLDIVDLTEMQRSFLGHEGAVDALGIEEVVQKDIEYFMSHIQHGKVYDDFKPDNIHYFNSEQELVPMAIDIFDEDAELIEWRENPQQISNPLAFYIEGNEKYEGIAEMYEISTSQAEKYVIDALGITESESYIGGEEMEQKPNPRIDIQIAVEDQLF